MDTLLEPFRYWSLAEATALLLAQNIIVFTLALLFGSVLSRWFASRRVAAPAAPLSRAEVGIAAATVLINTAVTVVGWLLWRENIVRFRDDVGVRALLDVPVLLLGMDAAMYLLHRLAHHRWVFGWMHALHHRYVAPRPLTLFVLHPFETAAFGLLWLTVITFYPASWLGLSIYLALNVAFGIIGHLGVEPLGILARIPILRFVANAQFHADHHADERHNFGFYTRVWDRLFRTHARNQGKLEQTSSSIQPV